MKKSANQWIRRLRSAWLVLLLAAALSACAALPPAPPETPLPDVEAVVALLRGRQNSVRSFAGRGSLQVKSPGSDYHLDMTVVAVRPDRLRLQAFDFMGRPVMLLTTDGDRLGFLDYRDEKMYQGAATPENFRRFLPLELSVPDVITLLSGGAPLSEYSRAALLRDPEPGRDRWRLNLLRPGGYFQESVWVSPPGTRLEKVEVAPPGEDAWMTLEYSGYAPADGWDSPHVLHMADHKARTGINIRYEEIRINPDLPGTLFNPPVPAGVQVLPIPDDDQGGNQAGR